MSRTSNRKTRVKRDGYRLARYLLNLKRPSKAENAGRLAARGETPESLTVREAQPSDIAALADLHVRTWNATYGPMLMRGPGIDTREAQWREAFAAADRNWFALVVETPDGRLIGFAKAKRVADASGQLEKIYLLGDYQRVGLGRRLVREVVTRLMAGGVTSMSAYVDPRNPSNAFFEAIGGTWLQEPNGSHNQSWYVWHDLPRVVQLCAAAT
jgi:ribosomal protein S18 acetylase RimI-like enzyme